MTNLNRNTETSRSTEPAIDYSTCYAPPLSVVYNEANLIGMNRFPDKHFKLAIVDPPYFSGPEKRMFY